jgi:hypothetical protein
MLASRIGPFHERRPGAGSGPGEVNDDAMHGVPIHFSCRELPVYAFYVLYTSLGLSSLHPTTHHTTTMHLCSI